MDDSSTSATAIAVEVVHEPSQLATHQKRIRHLRSLTVRNLSVHRPAGSRGSGATGMDQSSSRSVITSPVRSQQSRPVTSSQSQLGVYANGRQNWSASSLLLAASSETPSNAGDESGAGASSSSSLAPSGQLMDAYFTLHLRTDWSTREPFYVSETVMRSRNPRWRAIDLKASRRHLGHDVPSADGVLVQVWTRKSSLVAAVPLAAPSAGDFVLSIEWEVDFSGLRWLGPEWRLQFHHFPANTVLFQLDDSYYTYLPSLPAAVSAAASDTFLRIDQSALVMSCKQVSFMRIASVERAIAQLLRDLSRLEAAQVSNLLLNRRITHKKHVVQKLESRIASMQSALDSEVAARDALAKSIDARRRGSGASSLVVKALSSTIDEFSFLLREKSSALLTVRAAMEKRTVDVVFQLQEIYPLQNINGTPALRGIPLAVVTPSSTVEMERMATCLGYVCHLTLIISRYLQIPLRYSLVPMASRSCVIDEISILPAQEIPVFPLYPTGSEKYRFEYGVYLLNKDIEQILSALNISTKHIRNTLENLSLIYQHLSKQGISVS